MARELRVVISGDAKGLERALGSAGRSSKNLESTSSKLGHVLGGALRVGAYAAAGGAVALGYGMVKALNSAGDFQQQLNVLQAVSGATADQMKRISAESIALGKDVHLPATSAQDAAVAMTELAKAGLSVRDSMHAARGSLELAAAGNTDAATAATVTATALNQFSLAGTKAGHVADLLAGAANASAGDVVDFAEGLKYAGTSAHAAGQSIDLTVAALAEMANKGLQGSIAGSSLAQAMRNLQAPSAKAATMIKDLGLNIYDSAGKMKPLDEIAQVFTSHLGNMTQKTQNQTLATIFGSRSIQAARIVFLGGKDALDKYAATVSKTGSAQRLADARMKGFTGALQAFQSNVETLGIQLGLTLLPAATAATRELSSLVDVISAVAGAKTPSIAFHIAWQGAGKIYDSLKAALFGSVESLGTQGLKAGAAHGIQLPVQIDKKGIVPQIAAALAGVDWAAIGGQVGSGIMSGIQFTSAEASKLITSLDTAILANSNQIADVGAEIFAKIFANLLDPAFWAKNWKTGLAIGLTFLPVGDVLGIGAKLGKFLGKGLVEAFLRVAARMPEGVQKVIGLAVRLGEGLFSRLGDRAFAELQHALSRVPPAARRAFGSAISAGESLFSKLGSVISGKLSSALESVGKKIQSSLIGRTVAWLGKFTLIQTAINAISTAVSTVVGWIKSAVTWAGKLATAAGNIHFPHLPGLPFGLAGGTDYWRGGPTWVGEQGPEILNLPRGAQVIPHDRSMRMASGQGGSGVVVNQNITVQGGADTSQLLAAAAYRFAVGRVHGVA